MSIPRSEMAKFAMQELAKLHPELTPQQLMHAMAGASWDLDARPIVVSIQIPNTDADPIKVEIQHVPAEDLRRELGGG